MRIMKFLMSNVVLALLCYTGSFGDKFDKLIIACRTTDFDCFKYQYKMVRDKVLLGNPQLGFEKYDPLLFRYGNTKTCIKLSGLEKSVLTGIRYDAKAKEFSMTLELPFKIQQLPAASNECLKPDTPFKAPYHGATIQATFPFDLHTKNQEIYMVMREENLDVVLDIPDLSHYDKSIEFERKLYEQSEWAYNVVQHIDAAQHFAMPYTMRLRTLLATVPLRRFVNLYPDEEFEDINFNYQEPDMNSKETSV